MKWLSSYSRREMLRISAKVGVAVAGGLTLGPLVRFLSSQEDGLKSSLVTFQKKLEVNSDWDNIPSSRVWVKRDAAGVMALIATCTHLGCEVRFIPERKEWHCPCHGSIYDEEGKVLHGPADRALQYAAVELKQDGSLIVNTAKQVGIDTRAT